MTYKQIILSFFLLFNSNLFSQELQRYSCIADRINIAGMEESRTFDKNGIIMSANRYHPLSISQYGVLSYYNFLDTGDSIFYHKFINQINYFKDSTKVNFIFDGKGIGLPYNYNFWDLKSPWYSGMTQGYALSYLLRYYNHTNDAEILSIIKKVAFVLTSPQEKGGTISKTPEGYTWIEEYPNSKRGRQVLNGYINGLIGLKEYCDFFPEDTCAHRIFNETFIGLKKSLNFYDKPSWSSYDRKGKSLSNKYLRYQIYEMKHLNEIFNDTIFDNQMRIWSMFSHNKFIKEKSNSYKFKNHNIAVPVQQKIGELYGINSKPILTDSTVAGTSFILNGKRDLRRFYKNKNPKSNTRKSDINYIVFKLDSIQTIDCIDLIFSDSVKFNNVFILSKNIDKKNKYSKIDFYKIENNNQLSLSFNSCNLAELIIETAGNSNVLKKMNLYNTSTIKQPWFSYTERQIYELNANNRYLIEIPSQNTKRAVIFYRFHSDKKSINKSKWDAYNTVQGSFVPLKNGFYQFVSVFDITNPLSVVGKLTVIPQ